ncbi:MAG TPA: transposase [Vicinamibacterales bacterium]|nr:transposase [Vicinamibacterales bacterium]
MARPRRNTAPNAIHHIVNRANRKKLIFRKPEDYKAFVSILEEAVDRFGMRLIGFCIMPNHWHLVVWTNDTVSISAFMHWVTSTHVRRYHLHYGLTGTGHLYQARYRNHVCKDDDGVVKVMRYVEGNPVAAGLTERAQKWEWSSMRVRLAGDEAGFLTDPPVALPADWPTYVNENTPRRRGTAPPSGAKKAPAKCAEAFSQLDDS